MNRSGTVCAMTRAFQRCCNAWVCRSLDSFSPTYQAQRIIITAARMSEQRSLTNFDDCGFGKYCFISFRLAWLMPFKPSHNLLVRGSNPCGGTTNSERWAVGSVQVPRPVMLLVPR